MGAGAGTSPGNAWKAEIQGRIYEEVEPRHAWPEEVDDEESQAGEHEEEQHGEAEEDVDRVPHGEEHPGGARWWGSRRQKANNSIPSFRTRLNRDCLPESNVVFILNKESCVFCITKKFYLSFSLLKVLKVFPFSPFSYFPFSLFPFFP